MIDFQNLCICDVTIIWVQVIAEYSVKVFRLFVPKETMLSKFTILFLSLGTIFFLFQYFFPNVFFLKDVKIFLYFKSMQFMTKHHFSEVGIAWNSTQKKMLILFVQSSDQINSNPWELPNYKH